MKIGDYLYIHNGWGLRYLSRSKIVSQTPKRWVLENGEKIEKSTLSIVGDRFQKYNEETQSLRDEYSAQYLLGSLLVSLDKISERRNKYIKDNTTIDQLKAMIVKTDDLQKDFAKLLP